MYERTVRKVQDLESPTRDKGSLDDNLKIVIEQRTEDDMISPPNLQHSGSIDQLVMAQPNYTPFHIGMSAADLTRSGRHSPVNSMSPRNLHRGESTVSINSLSSVNMDRLRIKQM